MTRNCLVLGDSLEVLIDNRGKNPPFTTHGIPVVSGLSVKNGRLNLSVAKAVSDETWKKWMPNATRKHDVILTSEAPLGRVALVSDDRPLVIGQRVFGLRGKVGVLDSRFLYYALGTSQVQADLYGRATGTTVVGIRQPSLKQVCIPAPEYAEQVRIGQVLGTLDDKIAANMVLAHKADQLAQSLFERCLQEHEAPVRHLREVATLVLGGTPSRANADYWSNGSVPWLNSGKANDDRVISPSAHITQEALTKSAAKLMPVAATILAITGATLGQVARLEIEAAGNQSLIGIWGPSSHVTDWVHFAVRREMPQLLRSATGAAQQHVNKQSVAALLIPMADDVVMKEFGSMAGPLLARAAAADKESKALADARDALLPQLMSGKIRVMDAERVVEGVV